MSESEEVLMEESGGEATPIAEKKSFDQEAKDKGDKFMTAAKAIYHSYTESAEASDFGYCLLTAIFAKLKTLAPPKEDKSEGEKEQAPRSFEFQKSSIDEVDALMKEQFPEGDSTIRYDDLQWVRIIWHSKLKTAKQHRQKQALAERRRQYESPREDRARVVCHHFRLNGSCNSSSVNFSRACFFWLT
jgi:hypothetical protein